MLYYNFVEIGHLMVKICPILVIRSSLVYAMKQDKPRFFASYKSAAKAKGDIKRLSNQYCQIRGQHTFSVKSQTVSAFGFASLLVPVAAVLLCHHSTRVTIGNVSMNEHGCGPIKCYVWALNFYNFKVIGFHFSSNHLKM